MIFFKQTLSSTIRDGFGEREKLGQNHIKVKTKVQCWVYEVENKLAAVMMIMNAFGTDLEDADLHVMVVDQKIEAWASARVCLIFFVANIEEERVLSRVNRLPK